ncbi:MAG: hypothetical protein ABIE70_12370 [bacterium]
MIIKSFTASSVAAALKRVRQEMGGQAIVLKTVQNAASSPEARVEITACLDRPSVGQSSTLLARNNHDEGCSQNDIAVRTDTPEPQGSGQSDVSRRLKELEAQLAALLSGDRRHQPDPYDRPVAELSEASQNLRRADFPEEFIKRVMAPLSGGRSPEVDLHAAVHRELTSRLAAIMQPDLSFKPGDRIVFVGPAGAGKSSVMGKVAANLVIRDGAKVTLLTQDSTKLAAANEITSYATAIGADVIGSLADESEEKLKRNILLIDTPALPSDPDRIARLAERIEATRATHRVAVFSALTRSTDIPRLAELMLPLKATHVAMTMLDLTECHGSCVAAALATGCRIGFVTDAPGGIGRAGVPDPFYMARLALRQEVICE